MKKFINWIINFLSKKQVTSTLPPIQAQPIINTPMQPTTQPIATPTNQANIIRTYKDNETLGIMICTNKFGQTLNLKVLELPWKNNDTNISCIPEGTYQCVMSPFYATVMYQIMNVPKRKGIFQHPANFTKDILGCQAIGRSFADINGDGMTDVTDSKLAISDLISFFKSEPYTLTISSVK